MRIKNLVKPFYGKIFNHWMYGEDPRNVYKRTVACRVINNYSMIAIDVKEVSPREFINSNEDNLFVLDANTFPKEVQFENKKMIVYYAKPFIEFDNDDSNSWNQFTIDVFKERGIATTVLHPMKHNQYLLNKAWDQVEIKLKEMKKLNSFHTKDYGVFTLRVNYYTDKPYVKSNFYSEGFSYEEIRESIQSLYNNFYKKT